MKQLKIKEEETQMKQEKRILNKVNSKSGITLIALVITIIVLLILAGISISMLSRR